MIKVGIAGADTMMSGELIRILINHPDVEIMAVCAPGLKGERVDRVHHGLAGECELRFTEFLDPSQLDLVFIDAHSSLANHFRTSGRSEYDVKVIDMSHGETSGADEEVVYALAELNRRELVRNAGSAVVPRSISALSLIALYPLASHLMLDGDIEISVEAPADISTPDKLQRAAREIEHHLKRIQNSFEGDVSLRLASQTEESRRGMRIKVVLRNNSDPALLRELYSEQYSDHHFTHIGDYDMRFRQVEGTDKVLLTMDSGENEGEIVVTGIADCRMRGGAGDAVHAMNLMFGLCETTGLLLKAHIFD